MKTRCERCGCEAHGSPTQNPDARLLRRAVKGVCVDCGVVLFLQRLNNMHTRPMIDNRSTAPTHSGKFRSGNFNPIKVSKHD
jgi:hypothetical protein